MDTMNLVEVGCRPMELLMESDEEEASLLEEMEHQETDTVFKPTGVLKSGTNNISVVGGLQLRNNGVLCDVSNSVPTCVTESAANLPENGQFIENIQQNILQRLYSNNLTREESPNIATMDKLGEAQILQLDISESDLIAAKSAISLQSQNEKVATPSTSLAPHFINLDSVPGGLTFGEHAIFGQNITQLPGSNTNGELKNSKTKKRRDRKRNTVSQVKKGINRSIHPNSVKKTPLKALPPENSVRVREQPPSNEAAKSTQGSTEVVPGDKGSSSPEVSFCCHFCKLKYPLTKDNIPNIIKHMNPPERYNQTLKLPERFSSFRENIKLSILVAKDKSKAQVRLLSRLECSSCNQQLICNVENSEEISVHNRWCKKIEHDGKRAPCLYCNMLVPLGSFRKHLQCKSRKKCKKVESLTLQLMSSVCEKYAQQYRPICIVCNEKEWPYKGHRSELEPVCESCRFNITSGNTTRLVQRDVTGCAICGLHCADKFVTYWASELESLFIGEGCIKKLKNPDVKPTEKIAALKASKLNTLVETALSNVTVQESSENNCNTPRLAPNILSKYEDTINSFTEHEDNNTPIFAPKVLSKTENTIANLLSHDRKRKTATNNNLPVKIQDQGNVAKGQFQPITGSFKILNSSTSLPFAHLMPNSLLSDSKETENISSVANAPVVNCEDLDGKKSAEGSWTPKVSGTEKCETKNTEIKPQENAPQSKYCETKYPLIAHCKKFVTLDALKQRTSEGSNYTFKITTKAGSKSDTNTLLTESSSQPSATETCQKFVTLDKLKQRTSGESNFNFKITTKAGSKSDTNTLPTESSSQPSVTGTPVNSASHSTTAISRPVSNVTTDAQKPKYVIKYASALGDKSSDRTENVDKKHIIIKTSLSKLCASSKVKSPRLGKVIRTNMIVCSDASVENKHKK